MKCPACEQDVPAETGDPVGWLVRYTKKCPQTHYHSGSDKPAWRDDYIAYHGIEMTPLYAAPSPAWRPCTREQALQMIGELFDQAEEDRPGVTPFRLGAEDIMRLVNFARGLK